MKRIASALLVLFIVFLAFGTVGCNQENSTDSFHSSTDIIEQSSDKSSESEIESTADDTMVWIPTKGGKKYHSSSGCSNMDDPDYVTKSEAVNLGFTPCKKCYG